MKARKRRVRPQEDHGAKLSRALYRLRRESKMTQKAVARRTAELARQNPSFKRVHENQISEFERGRSMPHYYTLISLLAAMSPDGRYDLGRLQAEIKAEDSPDPPTPKVPRSAVLTSADLTSAIPTPAWLSSMELRLEQVERQTLASVPRRSDERRRSLDSVVDSLCRPRDSGFDPLESPESLLVPRGREQST